MLQAVVGRCDARLGPMRSTWHSHSLMRHPVRRGAWRRLCTPTGGVETVVAVGAPSRDVGSFGAWLRPWVQRIISCVAVLVCLYRVYMKLVLLLVVLQLLVGVALQHFWSWGRIPEYTCKT